MYFFHGDAIWDKFPELPALDIVVGSMRNAEKNSLVIGDALTGAGMRLDSVTECGIPSIQARRQGYTNLGLKLTQHCCAAEARLRRFRKDRQLPRLHCLIVVLNANSMRAAIPIAVFDLTNVQGGIEVLNANITKVHTTFQGKIKSLSECEIAFTDPGGVAHSRQWVDLQDAVIVVGPASDSVMIVAEAFYDTAKDDLKALKRNIIFHEARLGLTMCASDLPRQDSRPFAFDAPVLESGIAG